MPPTERISLCFPHDLIDEVHSVFKLRLLFRRCLDTALSTTAPCWASVLPHQVLASKRDAGVQSIDVLATGRRLSWEILQDRVQLGDRLIDSCLRLCQRFRERVLQRWCAIRTMCGGHKQLCLVWRARDCQDRAGSGRCKATGYACRQRSDLFCSTSAS